MTAVNIALVHHPVLNKNGERIGSAVTNLDLHDIARAARTYGVDHYFVTTPYEDQQQLVKEIISHWQQGYGAEYNPARKDALGCIEITNSIAEVVTMLTAHYGQQVMVITTSAKEYDNSISYQALREHIENDLPVLLLFGTAHGLAGEVMDMADRVLPPIKGNSQYNHLSVRSAASIILDRLLGSR